MNTNPLNAFRADIDNIDTEIVRLLASRFVVATQVARYKRGAGIEVRLNDRIVEVLDRVARLANDTGTSADAIRAIYEAIIEQTCRFEEAKIADGD